MEGIKIARLTRRQKDILNAIESYVNEKGYPPTYRELSSLVGIKSQSTVSTHLSNLKEKGYISFVPGAPRTLSIIKKPFLR